MNTSKTLKSLIAGLSLGIIVLTSCQDRRIEYSDINTESAIVSEKYHKNSYTYPVRIGHVTTIHTMPEVYKTKIDGKVDFTLSGKNCYNAFNKKDSVIVQYIEVYRSIYADKNKDNNPELVSKKFLRYECVNVSAKTK